MDKELMDKEQQNKLVSANYELEKENLNLIEAMRLAAEMTTQEIDQLRADNSTLQNQVELLEKHFKAHKEVISRAETVIAYQSNMLSHKTSLIALSAEYGNAKKKFEQALNKRVR